MRPVTIDPATLTAGYVSRPRPSAASAYEKSGSSAFDRFMLTSSTTTKPPRKRKLLKTLLLGLGGFFLFKAINKRFPIMEKLGGLKDTLMGLLKPLEPIKDPEELGFQATA